MQKNKKISVGSFGEKLQTNGKLTYGWRSISYGNHVVALIHNTISNGPILNFHFTAMTISPDLVILL